MKHAISPCKNNVERVCNFIQKPLSALWPFPSISSTFTIFHEVCRIIHYFSVNHTEKEFTFTKANLQFKLSYWSRLKMKVERNVLKSFTVFVLYAVSVVLYLTRDNHKTSLINQGQPGPPFLKTLSFSPAHRLYVFQLSSLMILTESEKQQLLPCN